MSILIKGMEMPTNGELLCINIYPDGKVCISLDLNCKQIAAAVPVPPHGRLIDADKLNKKPKKCFWVEDGASPKSEWFICASDLFDTPTVIPASKEGG